MYRTCKGHSLAAEGSSMKLFLVRKRLLLLHLIWFCSGYQRKRQKLYYNQTKVKTCTPPALEIL